MAKVARNIILKVIFSTSATEDECVRNLVPFIGVECDNGDVVLAGGGHRVWRVRRNRLALHEQDAARDGILLRDLYGSGAVEAAADDEGVTLLLLLIPKLLDGRDAGDLRRCMKGRAGNDRVLGRRDWIEGFAGDADGQGVLARLIPAGCGTHQVDADRVITIGGKNALEVLACLPNVHCHVLAAGWQHVEVVRPVRDLERNGDRLASAGTDQVVHIPGAFYLALNDCRGSALGKLHPLGAGTCFGSV